MLQLPCVSPQLGLQTVSSPRWPPRSTGCFDPWPSAKWSRRSTAARCFTATVWTADFLLTGRMGPLIYTPTPTVSLSVSLVVIQQMFAHILQHSHTWTHRQSMLQQQFETVWICCRRILSDREWRNQASPSNITQIYQTQQLLSHFQTHVLFLWGFLLCWLLFLTCSLTHTWRAFRGNNSPSSSSSSSH